MLSQQNTDALKLLEQCFDELDSSNLEVAKNKLQRAASFVDDEQIRIKLEKLNESQNWLSLLSFGVKKLPLSNESINPLSLGIDNITYQGLKENIHSISIELYKKLKYTENIHNSFNLLKELVDKKLNDLNPELLDKLRNAFSAVSLNKKEQNSLALTSCRRLLESLADELFPAQEEKINGRELGKNSYINRIWAYLDNSIESGSDKTLAKAHIDFLGSWTQHINSKNCKGVHGNVEHMEAVQTVFHTYLVLTHILNIK